MEASDLFGKPSALELARFVASLLCQTYNGTTYLRGQNVEILVFLVVVFLWLCEE